MTSAALTRPLRSHIRAVAEIAMAAYGRPTFFRFDGKWVPASRVLEAPRFGLDPVPDAMLLPQARVYEIDRDAWAGIVGVPLASRAGLYGRSCVSQSAGEFAPLRNKEIV